MEHDEKHPQPKFGGNRFIGARDNVFSLETLRMSPFKFNPIIVLLILTGGGGYSTLNWVRMCGPKFRPPPYNKTREDATFCYLYLNHSFLEGPILKPISAFYNVNWDA